MKRVVIVAGGSGGTVGQLPHAGGFGLAIDGPAAIELLVALLRSQRGA